MNKKEIEAKAEAYLEAAEHLTMAWTDDPLEYKMGLQLSEQFKEQADIILKAWGVKTKK